MKKLPMIPITKAAPQPAPPQQQLTVEQAMLAHRQNNSRNEQLMELFAKELQARDQLIAQLRAELDGKKAAA